MKKAKRAALQARKMHGGCSANRGKSHKVTGNGHCELCGAMVDTELHSIANGSVEIIIDDTPDDAELTVDETAGEYTPAEYDTASITVVERA